MSSLGNSPSKLNHIFSRESHKLINKMYIIVYSCHFIWILELFRCDNDKLLQCTIRHPADSAWYSGDVNRSARLLHVH